MQCRIILVEQREKGTKEICEFGGEMANAKEGKETGVKSLDNDKY